MRFIVVFIVQLLPAVPLVEYSTGTRNRKGMHGYSPFWLFKGTETEIQ